MPDLSPAEAMTLMLRIAGCGPHTPHIHRSALSHADGCPDCALLLYQAIEGPDRRKALAAAHYDGQRWERDRDKVLDVASLRNREEAAAEYADRMIAYRGELSGGPR